MPAGYLILDIDAGEDWSLALQSCQDDDPIFTPNDITGCSVRMQVRVDTDSAVALATISTAGGGVTLDEPNGYIYLKFSNAQTMAMAADNIDHVRRYDIEMTNAAGDVVPIIFGPANVRANVTR